MFRLENHDRFLPKTVSHLSIYQKLDGFTVSQYLMSHMFYIAASRWMSTKCSSVKKRHGCLVRSIARPLNKHFSMEPACYSQFQALGIREETTHILILFTYSYTVIK